MTIIMIIVMIMIMSIIMTIIMIVIIGRRRVLGEDRPHLGGCQSASVIIKKTKLPITIPSVNITLLSIASVNIT